MSYTGEQVTIPLGISGIVSDLPQDKTPEGAMLRAENIDMINSRADKAPGSVKFNQTALADKVMAFHEYKGANDLRKIISLVGDGTTWRHKDKINQVVVSAAAGSEVTLKFGRSVHIMDAGNEGSGKTKKVFIFTGRSPVQVIDDDGLTRSDITTPATDWTLQNQPTFGIMHRNRVWAFGNENFPHVIYTSLPGDHEDFASAGVLTNFVFPEDGERISGAFVFKKKLFLTKFPQGLFQLNDDDVDDTKWFFAKINADFGTGSPHAVAAGLNDVFVLDSANSITQMSAVQKFGDVEAADFLRNNALEKFIRESAIYNSYEDSWALYDKRQKRFYFTYRTRLSLVNDRLLVVDFTGGRPRFTWSTKDDPICLGLVTDTELGPVASYGSNDGYIMMMNSETHSVQKASNVAYDALLQTTHMDFNDTGDKAFDFLELQFEPTGRWDVSADVFIDGILKETVLFQVSTGDVLDDFAHGTGKHTGLAPRTLWREIHGQGRNISIRLSNSGLDQGFKLLNMTIYFRRVGQDQKAGSN